MTAEEDSYIQTILEKWSVIEEVVDILCIPFEVTTALETANLTMSDLFGALLQMEIKLEQMQKKQNQQTNLADILFAKFSDRKKKLIENPAMKCAIFLDPRYNYELTPNETKVAKYTLDNLYVTWKQKVERTETLVSSKEDPFEEYQKAKRKRSAVAAIESTDPNNLTILMEKYEASLPELHYKESILKYWENCKEDHPVLYQLACIINTIAPTQVTVERAFSILGLVYTNRRTSLAPDLLEHILIIKLNKEMVPSINVRDLQNSENYR